MDLLAYFELVQKPKTLGIKPPGDINKRCIPSIDTSQMGSKYRSFTNTEGGHFAPREVRNIKQ